MNENRFNACCEGCYYGTGCENRKMSESGGEMRTKENGKMAITAPNKPKIAVLNGKTNPLEAFSTEELLKELLRRN